MDAQEVQDLSVSYEISQSLNPSSFTTTMSSDTSNLSYHDTNAEMHDISLTIDPSKEIGTIAEREVTLNRFEMELKCKRTVIIVCYLIIFIVESVYFKYFSYWIVCPLLLCLGWLSLLSFNTNLYPCLHKRAHIRSLFISSLSMLNIFTVVSFIIIYAMHFSHMSHFNHHDDYSLNYILFFNIMFVFCSFCIDLDIIDHRDYTVFAYKFIFGGCINHEIYQIEMLMDCGLKTAKRFTIHQCMMRLNWTTCKLNYIILCVTSCVKYNQLEFGNG
eukprot:290055_1